MHKNLSLMMKLNIEDLDACKSIFADEFIWHYFNQRLPDLDGDYRGVDGFKKFFTLLSEKSDGSFQRDLVDVRTAGEELVITHVRNCMNLDGNTIEVDAIVVWRIVNNKIAEAWDIPAVNTARSVE